MMTAKLFENGRSQAVRLPKEYRFQRRGGCDQLKLVTLFFLMPKDNKWAGFFKQFFSFFSDDFMEDGREEPQVQEREVL